MPVQVPCIRIFLSSPGDVADERTLALQVIDQLPYDPLLRGKFTFEVIAWDKPGAGTPMLATMTPQEAINQGLPRPSESDIVVVILWARMGTPLPHPEYKKANGDPYWSGTEWEYEDAMQAAREFRRPEVVVYRRTERVMFDPADAAFTKKLDQWKRVQTFFESFTDRDTGAILKGYNQYDTPNKFRSEFETHLKVLVKKFLHEPEAPIRSTVIIPEVPIWEGSPFPGLRAFTEADAPIFFGRGRKTDELITQVGQHRFVAVVGASGSGKSSLVGAGLIPRLKSHAIVGKEWRFIAFRPGEASNNPFESLYNALLKTFPALQPNALEAGRVKRAFLDDLLTYPDAFAETCLSVLSDAEDWVEIMLFIDQFEELFTIVDEKYQKPFIEMLVKLADADRVRSIVTVRSDLYHKCVEYPALAELLRGGSFLLPAPEMDALFEMITRPADRAALQFEEGLPGRILRDTGEEPGSLALMAYLLDELYHKRDADGKLTFEAYEKLGGVQGAIGTRAEQIFAELEGTDDDKEAWMQRVFYKLVKVDESSTSYIVNRDRASLESIALEDMKFTDAFVNARLLVKEEDTLEVAHEALFRSWARLEKWIKDNLDFMTEKDRLESLKRLAEADKIAIRSNLLGEYQKIFETMPGNLKADCQKLLDELVDLSLARLVKELDDPDTAPQRRKEVGDEMAQFMNMVGAVGLTQRARPGVGLRPGSSIPDIVFEPVEGGLLDLRDSEGWSYRQEVAPFEIARYPVTRWQYLSFITSPDVSKDSEWWKGVCEWNVQRQDYSWQAVPSNPIFANRDSRPGNRPVTGVSWFSAMAFCNWLTAKYQQEGWLPERYCVRLPTEFEWVLAALGADLAQPFPWGTHAISSQPPANLKEAELNSIVAVGLFPLDRAASGHIMDMAGNVKEWCLNGYDALHRINLLDNEKAALRGGAFDVSMRDISSLQNYREGTRPRLSDQNTRERIGFRVVLAQANPQILQSP